MAMTLSPLADIEDLCVRLGTGPDDKLAAWCLDQVSADFRQQTGAALSWVESLTLLLDGDGSRSLLLPIAHIGTVASVRLFADQPTVDPRVLVDRVDYQISRRNGILRRVNGLWPDGLENIEVVCSYGYKLIPDGIQAVILDAAAQLHGIQPGVTSMTVDAESVTWSASGLGISESWSKAVQAYSVGGPRA